VISPPGYRISEFERHLNTPEILIPSDTPFVLPLLSEEGQVEAFHINLGEAVVIHSGVWHGPCIPVNKSKATYFVIFRQHTPAEDVEKKSIADVIVQV
jgi:ureidoglycolate hydrolase